MLVPVTRKQANAFIRERHRHHRPTQGYRWAVGAAIDGKVVGIAVVGRPVGRNVDWQRVVEVTRLCTDGTKNVCSFLYAASARAAAAMGYEAIQTYILAAEPGTSLRASGWRLDGTTKGRAWSHTEGHPLLFADGATRENDHPLTDKQRWVKALRRATPSGAGCAATAELGAPEVPASAEQGHREAAP